MNSDWKYVKLGEIVNFNTGKLDSNQAERDGLYPFFTCSPVTLAINTAAFNTEAVLLAGNNASGVYSVKYYNGEFNAYQRTYVVTPKNRSQVSTKWLYFRIKNITEELQQLSVGSATKFLTKKILENFEIKLPDMQTQEKQECILWSIENKIELNHKTNQTLEKMVQTLFKSWFVDFDPVHAKNNAGSNTDYEQIAKELGVSCKVLDLFTADFEDDIPKGWELTNLSSVFTERKVKVKDNIGMTVMSVIKTGEIVSPEEVFTKQVHSKDISKYKLIYPLDLGYNPSRINIGSVGFNKKDIVGAISPIYTVMKLNYKKYYPFSELFIRDSTTKEWIKSLSTGSVRLSLSQKDFLSIPVVLPCDILIDEFNTIYNSLYEAVTDNKIEINTLQETRDILLPKLLSGELDVSELELDNATH